MTEEIVNRGTGAGGANTNVLGKKFEEDTCNEKRLLSDGFKKVILNKSKFGYYIEKEFDDYFIKYLSQGGLKAYFARNNIEICRNPDEAYVIVFKNKDERPILKILEKKEQSKEGSVETKLMSGSSFRREYEIMLDENYIVHYAYCVNDFLKKKLESGDKKYNVLKQILREDNIPMFYGEDSDYFDKLDNWIHMF
jgi:hypothetical protein